MTLPPMDRLSVEELEQLVDHHNRLYWESNAPEISDPEFDRLTRRLLRLAPESPVLLTLGPSRFGAEVVHATRMLSLDKSYTEDEVEKFVASFSGPAVVSPKIDGVACSLIYAADGRLQLATTRGDGQRGEDISANARQVKDIPTRVPRGGVEVRGELYLERSRFQAHFAADFANPRNLTAGAIKQKDPRRCAAYGLSFFAYDLLNAEVESEWDKATWLCDAGFTPPPAERVAQADVVAAVRRIAARRDEFDYETDGVVIKADDLAEHRRLGTTAHHPRYAIAFKFQGETGETLLKDVEWSVSRTGTITPVALVEPIDLSGVTVSRASLHNASYIERLGLSRGCRVEVTRRGGVIPHVERVLEPGAETIALPERCPSCGAGVIHSGDFMRCAVAESCPDAVVGTLEHFTKVLDIQGFGRKHLRTLVERGIVHRPVDFFRLTVEALLPLDRMGDRLARKLIDAIEARRRIRWDLFLVALGIDELGPVLAEQLAHQYADLAELRGTTMEELASLHGVGEVVARYVTRGLVELGPLIDQLLEVIELLPLEAIAVAEGHLLAGRSVLFTGKLARTDRKKAQQQVRSLGGKTPSSVTRDLDYLVVGDEGSPLLGSGNKSTKQRKAETYNAQGATIQIVTEQRFGELLTGS